MSWREGLPEHVYDLQSLLHTLRHESVRWIYLDHAKKAASLITNAEVVALYRKGECIAQYRRKADGAWALNRAA